MFERVCLISPYVSVQTLMAERDKEINTVGAATSASPSGRESAGPPLPSSQPLNGPTPHPVRSKTTKLTIDQYRHKTNKASFSSLSEPGSSKGQALGEVSSGDGPSSRPPSSMPNFGSAGSRGVVPPPPRPSSSMPNFGSAGSYKGVGLLPSPLPVPPPPPVPEPVPSSRTTCPLQAQVPVGEGPTSRSAGASSGAEFFPTSASLLGAGPQPTDGPVSHGSAPVGRPADPSLVSYPPIWSSTAGRWWTPGAIGPVPPPATPSPALGVSGEVHVRASAHRHMTHLPRPTSFTSAGPAWGSPPSLLQALPSLRPAMSTPSTGAAGQTNWGGPGLPSSAPTWQGQSHPLGYGQLPPATPSQAYQYVPWPYTGPGPYDFSQGFAPWSWLPTVPSAGHGQTEAHVTQGEPIRPERITPDRQQRVTLTPTTQPPAATVTSASLEESDSLSDIGDGSRSPLPAEDDGSSLSEDVHQSESELEPRRDSLPVALLEALRRYSDSVVDPPSQSDPRSLSERRLGNTLNSAKPVSVLNSRIKESPIVQQALLLATSLYSAKSATHPDGDDPAGQESFSGLPRGKIITTPTAPLISKSLHWLSPSMRDAHLPHELTADDRARLRISQLPAHSKVSSHNLGLLETANARALSTIGGVDTLLSALIAALSDDNAESFELAQHLDAEAIRTLVSSLSSAVSRCADLVGSSYMNMALLRRDAALSISSLSQPVKDELRSLPMERSSLFGSSADAVLQRATQAAHNRAMDRIAEGFPNQTRAPKRPRASSARDNDRAHRKMPKLKKITTFQHRQPAASRTPRPPRGRVSAKGKRQHPQ